MKEKVPAWIYIGPEKYTLVPSTLLSHPWEPAQSSPRSQTQLRKWKSTHDGNTGKEEGKSPGIVHSFLIIFERMASPVLRKLNFVELKLIEYDQLLEMV